MCNLNNICVTGGASYTDIDVLACAIAYGELMACDVVLPGRFNKTIPAIVNEMCELHFHEIPQNEYTGFVIVDVSNPAYFPEFVSEDNIIMVFDHHAGFEEYWKSNGRIESVGACATLIWELFEAANKKPSASVANLLYTAIFANTLNFKARITSHRDLKAFESLKRYISLPKDWIRKYYAEVESEMFSNFECALASDTKILDNGWVVMQLEMYDASYCIKNVDFYKTLEKCTAKYTDWLLTMPSISEGINYLASNSDVIKNALKNSFGVAWEGDVGKSNVLFLRKEILKTLNIR